MRTAPPYADWKVLSPLSCVRFQQVQVPPPPSPTTPLTCRPSDSPSSPECWKWRSLPFWCCECSCGSRADGRVATVTQGVGGAKYQRQQQQELATGQKADGPHSGSRGPLHIGVCSSSSGSSSSSSDNNSKTQGPDSSQYAVAVVDVKVAGRHRRLQVMVALPRRLVEAAAGGARTGGLGWRARVQIQWRWVVCETCQGSGRRAGRQAGTEAQARSRRMRRTQPPCAAAHRSGHPPPLPHSRVCKGEPAEEHRAYAHWHPVQLRVFVGHVDEQQLQVRRHRARRLGLPPVAQRPAPQQRIHLVPRRPRQSSGSSGCVAGGAGCRRGGRPGAAGEWGQRRRHDAASAGARPQSATELRHQRTCQQRPGGSHDACQRWRLRLQRSGPHSGLRSGDFTASSQGHGWCGK